MERSPRDAKELVEEQVLRWQAQERAALPPPRAHWPVITVSREYGAAGTDLARMVADRLRFDFWDQEIVHLIAQETGASEALLRSLDEHARGALDDMIEGILFGVAYTESEYLRQLMRVVHTISRHGRAVLVGRGANFVLHEHEALRVRIVCPIVQRIERVAMRHEIDPREARSVIEREDRERAAFLRHQFGKDASDPTAYDIVLNTGSLTLHRAADIIIAAYDARFGTKLQETLAEPRP